MLKCNVCKETYLEHELGHGSTTNTGYNLPDGGYTEYYSVCPCCGAHDEHENAYLCGGCFGYFTDEDDYYDQWCHECAKEQFTIYLGLAYLIWAELKSDFKFYNCKNGLDRHHCLQDFIFQDMENWIDFLNSDTTIDEDQMKTYVMGLIDPGGAQDVTYNANSKTVDNEKGNIYG